MPLAEREFANMCGRMNIWCHKWSHMRKCPVCHSNLFVSKQSSDQDEEETQTIVDYLTFIGSEPLWVECKGTNKSSRINIRDEPSLKQRGFLDSWLEKGVNAALFLLLGEGRPPNGRGAYLIPWDWWQEVVYPLVDDGMFSLPWLKTNRKNDRDLFIDGMFYNCALTWVKGVGWLIPEWNVRNEVGYKNIWPMRYPNILTLPSLY